MINRRTFIASAASLSAGAFFPANARQGSGSAGPQAQRRFESIRDSLGKGGRIGVAAIDTGSGRTLSFDAASRYAMASTFKLPLAAAVLAAGDRGALSLSEQLKFGAGDPLANSPVVEEALGRGRLSAATLARAIVRVSDNSAANLLLRRIGGPEALTRFVRSCGDRVTRLDRFEMELNSNLPGDPRDTTSPAAMAQLARRLVLGDVLKPASRARLAEWLKTSVPGADRLRAGVPAGWTFGHKTGTGARGAVNDVGIAWPPGRAPIVIASFQSGGTASPAAHAAAHAAVARLALEMLSGSE